MRLFLFCLLGLLASNAPAFADDEPPYIKEFGADRSSCRPSCYQNEPAVPWDASSIKRVCGYKDWNFQQTQVGRSWTALESRGIPAVEPTVTSCKLPGDAGGVAKSARAAFQPFKDDLKDLRFVVQGGWHAGERDANLHPVRWITVRVFASNWGEKPNECGAHGDVACEASGSKSARAINYVHYRLDEAKQLQSTDEKGCRTSSFFAVATARGLVKFRDARMKKKQWATGVKYKTRFDGELDEKTLFAKVATMEKEALALHKACGGASPLVTESHAPYTTPPEFEMVPDPANE